MHTLKSYLLIIAFYLCSSALVFAQCPAVITQANPTLACQKGPVVLTASSGTDYTYKWYKDNVEITGLVPTSNMYSATVTGTYTVQVTGPSCTAAISDAVVLNLLPKASFEIKKKERIIAADCTPVKVIVDPDSTKGADTYQWKVLDEQENDNVSPAAYSYFSGNSNAATPVFQFNTKGRYSIRMIVSNACGKDSTTQSVLIALPEVNVNPVDPSCGPTTITFDSEKVTFDANLGTLVPGSYSWSIKKPNGSTEQRNVQNLTFTFDQVGTYKVTASVRNECGSSTEVTQPGATTEVVVYGIPPAPVAQSGTVCPNNSYTFRPTVTGYTTFNFYRQQAGSTPIASGVATFTEPNITQNTTIYIATVTPDGCESPTKTAFTVTLRPGVVNNTISPPANQQVCAGTAAGTITGSTATINGSETPYRWIKSTTSGATGFTAISGATGRNLTPTGLATGENWFKRIAVSTTCNSDTTDAILITVSPNIANGANNLTVSNTNPVCAGNAGPEIVGSAISGVQYSWFKKAASENVFTEIVSARGSQNLMPGVLNETTQFKRRVETGPCSNEATVTITVQPGPGANEIQGGQTVCASSTANVTLTGTALSGVTFRWEQSATGNTNDFTTASGTFNKANYTFSPSDLNENTYFRRVVISTTCGTSTSSPVLVTVIQPIANNTITATNPGICQGGTTTITGSNLSNVTFEWQFRTSASSAYQTIVGATGPNYTTLPTNQRTFYRRLAKVNGSTCPAEASAPVEITVVNAPPAPTVASSNVAACMGAPATLRATGNASSYEWYKEATGGTPIFVGQEYITDPIVAPTSFYVQAVNGTSCASLSRTEVKVSIVTVNAYAGRDTTIIEGQFTSLRATGGVSYVWSPATGLNNPNIANPVASPIPTLGNNKFIYTVTVTNANGCTGTDEVEVTVIPRVKIVNTFSPNGDGINEVWEIGNIQEYPLSTVEIFNRWGAPVFKGAGKGEPWDGTYNGKPLPLDTYYYIIRLSPGESPYKGSVTIIR